MALWFTLMINSTQIGDVTIVRRGEVCEGEYMYGWTVSKFQTGTTKCAPTVHSGELTHVYDDGAFELVRKVMEAFQETSARKPADATADAAKKTI